MKTSEILIAAKKLIEDEKNWIQGTYAVDDKGFLSGARWGNEDDAVCFCSLGAIANVSGVRHGASGRFNPFGKEWPQEAEDLLMEVVDSDIHTFNDTHTHAEVMEMWDKAIKLAIEKENV